MDQSVYVREAIKSLVGLSATQEDLIAKGLAAAAAEAAAQGRSLDQGTIANFSLQGQSASTGSMFAKKISDEDQKAREAWTR